MRPRVVDDAPDGSRVLFWLLRREDLVECLQVELLQLDARPIVGRHGASVLIRLGSTASGTVLTEASTTVPKTGPGRPIPIVQSDASRCSARGTTSARQLTSKPLELEFPAEDQPRTADEN